MARSACDDGLLATFDLSQLRLGLGRDGRRRRQRVRALLIEGQHLADDQVVGGAALQLVESRQIVERDVLDLGDGGERLTARDGMGPRFGEAGRQGHEANGEERRSKGSDQRFLFRRLRG